MRSKPPRAFPRGRDRQHPAPGHGPAGLRQSIETVAVMQKDFLDNGARVVMERMPFRKSVAVGVWEKVGTRDEGPHQKGLAHFLEHMMFKGTRRRSATRISHEIDSLGGEMNAFTTHETTALYLKVLDQQLGQAVDLLADIFHHSLFDRKEIEREKQVVLEEIRTVRDDPEDFVQELHAGQVLRGHPLGRSILGDRAIMKRIQRPDVLRYRDEHYRPEKTVIAVAGNFQVKAVTALLNASFGQWHLTGRAGDEGGGRHRPPRVRGGTRVHPKRLEQVHLCVGFKGLPVAHPARYAAHMLNALLGGGMSSRLFREIREKRGLAYTIYSQLSSFSDAGVLTVYAASGAKEAPLVVEVVCREVKKLRKRGPAPDELERTKNQLKGTLMLGLEGTYGRMSKLAKDEIAQGRYVSLRELESELDRVSARDVQEISRELLDFDSMAVTALGPVNPAALQAEAGNGVAKP